MRGLPGDSESGENPIMPNKKMQRMAGDALFFLFLSLGPPPLIFGVMQWNTI
jgi:hypothetical protein